MILRMEVDLDWFWTGFFALIDCLLVSVAFRFGAVDDGITARLLSDWSVIGLLLYGGL